PVVISPPLAGPNWLDANSCCDMTPHRMALNPINGEIWAAERFAIDYLQLGPDGRVFTGEKTEVRSYPYFGSDILAVGDGPVVSVLDGLPEQVPGTAPTGLTLEQYGGNHIVQDLGNGNYAFYAHLQTGSVTV
ncbi:peptidase M23, partial [Mycobacterium sp. ITM-2017-0098]